MKQLYGSTKNVVRPIMGRVTLNNKNIFNRKDYILVKQNLTDVPNGYAAVISNISMTTPKTYIWGTFDFGSFTEGDVIEINPDGTIKFLYEKNSIHNAIFVTGRCNHRCIMCPQPPVSQEDNSTELNLKLISLYDKNTKSIGITGGEPTLIGDDLFKIIRQIKKYCPKASIDILTNGVMFANFNYAFNLANCNCPDIQIEIPIFSDIAAEHNRIVGANTFYKTVEGLYNLAKINQRIGLRIVIHKQTYKRLPQLSDFIYRNFPFVSQVAFLQMETTGLAKKNIDELWIDPFDYNNELMESISLLHNRDIPALIYNAQLCVLPPELHSSAVKSITDWKDGFLAECEGCHLKNKCPGIFTTNGKYVSRKIKRLIS